MEKIERRLNKRIAAEFKIKCFHAEDYIISYSKDISADGIFFLMENPPSEGSKIKLTFSVDDSKPFTLVSEVVWVNTGEDQKDRGVGVRFIDPSPELKETILKLVNRVVILEDNG